MYIFNSRKNVYYNLGSCTSLFVFTMVERRWSDLPQTAITNISSSCARFRIVKNDLLRPIKTWSINFQVLDLLRLAMNQIHLKNEIHEKFMKHPALFQQNFRVYLFFIALSLLYFFDSYL